jgi:hypothetical protein
MDVPLAGLGVFGGWIVLVVASDVFGLLRIPPRQLTTLQSGLLLFAIAATLGCGFLYAQERHGGPCPAIHARR